MPLEISITTGSPVPIYRQIVDQVCRAVATGQLVPGRGDQRSANSGATG